MNRRNLLRLSAGGACLGLLGEREQQAQVLRATRAMPSPKIKDVRVIATEPAGVRLSVVKILTDQDGLYGYGCATFTQRAELVNAAIEKYLRPFLIGKPADRIEDLWQACYNSSYWRNGPVLNNALSGVDEALWDIKGRQAGMPVYELLGGKCREAAEVYVHVGGETPQQAVDNSRRFLEQGFRNLRLQAFVPGSSGFRGATSGAALRGLRDEPYFEPGPYLKRALQYLETCRRELGDEAGLMYDLHERIAPNQAVQFAKEVEPLKLVFLEDPLSPEDLGYFRQIRQQCSTPIAMGELFNSPHEWTPLINERLIDYMRMHVSQMGGLTPARKVAAMGEIMGVRTAWHGPGDVAPIGHAAQLALDLACYNFGVQEYTPFNEPSQEIFQGCPVIKDGYWYATEAPGYGIEVDEKAAARFPYGTGERPQQQQYNGGWGEIRRRDGTIIKQ